jgi:hypothetical protein
VINKLEAWTSLASVTDDIGCRAGGCVALIVKWRESQWFGNEQRLRI